MEITDKWSNLKLNVKPVFIDFTQDDIGIRRTGRIGLMKQIRNGLTPSAICAVVYTANLKIRLKLRGVSDETKHAGA